MARNARMTLPLDRVRDLAKEGLGPTDIARALEKECGYLFTTAAVSKARQGLGFPPLWERRGLTPWLLRPEHRHLHWPRMLRAEARVRAGEGISTRTQGELEAFKGMLHRVGAVVHYDPGTVQGFWLVSPREGVDTDLIRKPDQE